MDHCSPEELEFLAWLKCQEKIWEKRANIMAETAELVRPVLRKLAEEEARAFYGK